MDESRGIQSVSIRHLKVNHYQTVHHFWSSRRQAILHKIIRLLRPRGQITANLVHVKHALQRNLLKYIVIYDENSTLLV